MITIDGTNYNAEWTEYTQTAEIMNGSNSGRLQGSQTMYLEYVGTFINSQGTIRRTRSCTDAEWNTLFEKLANKRNKHTVKIPWGTSGTKTLEIYVSSIERSLVAIRNGANVWSPTYSVNYVAIAKDRSL